MADTERILSVKNGMVQCLADKQEAVEQCAFCVHCREFRIGGTFVQSPSLAYCTRCRPSGKVDYKRADAVKCADRQRGGFHSITNLIS